MPLSIARRLCAEALGSLLLLAGVVGSGIMGETLSAGNDAIALLGNTLATGALLVVLIRMLAPVSGAHFNPAVSLVFALRRELSARDLAAYAAVQVIGGILGSWLVHLMFEAPVLQLSQHVRSGPAQWLSEGVATFGLLLTILVGIRQRPDAVPALVGLYIGAAYWFTASTSFANPAVTIARALTDSFSGIRPLDAPGFIVMQILGALLAAAFAGLLVGPVKETRP